MMSFMAALLRAFVAIAIALFVIAGAAAGWFFDEFPILAKQISAMTATDSPVTHALMALGGALAGLIAATMIFGLFAVLLDIRDKLIELRQTLDPEQKPTEKGPLRGQKP